MTTYRAWIYLKKKLGEDEDIFDFYVDVVGFMMGIGGMPECARKCAEKLMGSIVEFENGVYRCSICGYASGSFRDVIGHALLKHGDGLYGDLKIAKLFVRKCRDEIRALKKEKRIRR